MARSVIKAEMKNRYASGGRQKKRVTAGRSSRARPSAKNTGDAGRTRGAGSGAVGSSAGSSSRRYCYYVISAWSREDIYIGNLLSARKPEVHAKSRAAGPPAPSLRKKTSAGLLRWRRFCSASSGLWGKPSSAGRPGSRPAFSFSAPSEPLQASVYTTLRSALWRTVRSPWQGQTRAWSP